MVSISFECGSYFFLELTQGSGFHQRYFVLDEVWDRSVDVVHVDISEVSDFGIALVYFLDYAACAVSKCSYHVFVGRDGILAASVADIDFIALSMESKHYDHLAGSYLAEALHVELHNIKSLPFVKYFSLCEHVSQFFWVSRIREELSQSIKSQLYRNLSLGNDSSLSLYLRKRHWLVIDMLPIRNSFKPLHILHELGGNCLQLCIAWLFLHILLF